MRRAVVVTLVLLFGLLSPIQSLATTPQSSVTVMQVAKLECADAVALLALDVPPL